MFGCSGLEKTLTIGNDLSTLIHAPVGKGNKDSGIKEGMFWWILQKISSINILRRGLWAYGVYEHKSHL
jgi:hypothetical protein